MNFFRRILRKIQITFGSSAAKRKKWDDEYESGKWNYLENEQEEPRDSIQEIISKYSEDGYLLDLGCGTGTTFFRSKNSSIKYTGVDISELAINRCITKYESIVQTNNATFIAHDIDTYEPKYKYNVILFSESIYYLKKHKILPMLVKLSNYLCDSNAVFIVTLYNRYKYNYIELIIRGNFNVIEEYYSRSSNNGSIIIFRPGKNLSI
jgi:cyclopropane fatty-acyl-phospholipid synthase-like methyltransferase